MIQSLFIIADTGEVLLEKQWTGKGGDRAICDWFWDNRLKASTPRDVPSVLAAPQCYCFHILRSSITFLACSVSETPPLAVLEFLSRVADVLEEYVGAPLSEDFLKAHFVSVHEVVEEMMDGGIPLVTEPNALKEICPPPSLVRKVVTLVAGTPPPGPKPPPAQPVTEMGGGGSSVPWRGDGIRYNSNEIYCDLIEEVDAVIDRNGFLLRCDIFGVLQTTARLSEQPEISISLSNPALLSDTSFHRCVRKRAWAADRAIVCIPPDGTAKLMNYRVTGVKAVPLYARPQLSWSREGGGRMSAVVGVKNDPGVVMEGVTLTLPLPTAVTSADLVATHGTVSFDQQSKVCMWVIGRMPNNVSPSLQGQLKVAEGEVNGNGNGVVIEERPTVTLSWKMAGVTLSGLRVERVVVQSDKYRPFKCLRAMTRAGCFEIRT